VPAAPVTPQAPAPVSAPVVVAAPVLAPGRRAPRGPTFDRAALEVHAGGRISSIFGPLFEQQDVHTVQVRMPMAPLLLADRVTGLDCEPGVLAKGVIWTETDVRADAFYMHAGRMTPGVMIESGQADLMLVSYQGIDFRNKGTRAYRLLGCNLTFHGSPPKSGETLAYEIHGDGHANQGDVRLFFFHYDCWIGDRRALSVREGQAGFFTTEELAKSAGILWSPETSKPEPGGRVDPPRKRTHSSFDKEQLRAFADQGNAHACFGPGFERAATHTRTPAIPGGRMLFLDRVTHFDPEGGPWKRGYLRATQAIHPDDWFFEGHFKNDPCMPGTLMFDGCLATMAFYLAALGYTLDKDGYRFEPIPEEEYKLKCRGQVIPTSKELVYEVFVEEVHDGDEPRLYADLLCTVDGLGAFHARRVGLRLVPDWPLTSMAKPPVDDRAVASVDGLPLDFRSLLACAWGQPSTAFGPRYARFDGTRRVPRLPGPPYHYVTRVLSYEGEPFVCKPGAAVEVEYDVPPDAWYFGEGGAEAMPFSVLLEAALQPCGWLASFVGSTLTVDGDLLFRNLDGKGVIFDEVRRDAGVLRTRAKIVNVSPASGMLIESFEVECFVGDRLVFKVGSAFGFFPKEALENQIGLPTSPEQRAAFDAPSDYFVDLRPEPARYLGGAARLSRPMLRMIDRVTRFEAEGGKKSLGVVRADMDVDPHAWFFKAHFFQDPVQPGSLGVEAMRQTLAFAMLELGLAEGIPRARFLPLESRKAGEGVTETPELVWKYRGQVVPESQRVTITMEIVDRGRDARGSYARAEASLWVDGKRIYEARGLGLRIVSADDAEEVLDLARDGWLRDHCPTFVLPALPMMSVVDRLAGAAMAHGFGLPLTLENVQIKRWITVDPSARLRTEVAPRDDGSLAVSLLVFRSARDPKLSRFEVAATGIAWPRATAAAPIPALVEGRPTENPYDTGELFHGPAFQLLRSRTLGENGGSAVLDAGAGTVPYGTLHQALLDAATHAIPHDRLHLLSDLVGEDKVAYPYRIASLAVHAPLPRAGEVRCEARFVGFDGDDRFPTFDLALEAGGVRLCDVRLVEILMPKGSLGAASGRARRSFLQDRAFVPGLFLSDHEGGVTRLSDATVAESDWLPGTIARIYGLGTTDDRTRDIAQKEHVARQVDVHPSAVALVPEPHAPSTPLRRFALEVVREADAVRVSDRRPPRLDLDPVRRFWTERFGLSGWPVEDLCFGLAQRFVADVRLADPAAFRSVAGQSVLYVANHQTGIESILFSVLFSALAGTTTMTLAKAEHRDTWLGRMLRLWFSYPGAHDPGVIAHFDRKDSASLLTILEDLARAMRTERKSLLVHVEGTRALSCRAPVATMSGTFVDLALALGAPVVPVRFTGGLPITPATERLEFPVGMGQQTYHVGAPILPTELAALTYKARIDRLVSAINGLGGDPTTEVPHAADDAFAAKVHAFQRTDVSAPHAVLRAVLEECPAPSAVTRKILARDTADLGAERAFAQTFEELLFGAR